MHDKLINKILTPEFSIIIMCIFSSLYIIKIESKYNMLLILCDILISILCLIRYIKNKKYLLLFISEIIGINIFCIVYLVLYHRLITTNEINILFILLSLVFLVPLFVEIALNKQHK